MGNGTPEPPPPQPLSTPPTVYTPNNSPTSSQPANDVAEPAADGVMGNETAGLTRVALELLALLPSLL